MIEKILLKLSVNSLMNLRYVSNDLWRLITSPSFIQLHLAQLNNPNSLLISCRARVICKVDGFFGIQFKTYNYDCNFPIITSNRSPEIIRPESAEIHLPFESTEIRASSNGNRSPEIIRPESAEIHLPFESTEIRASCNGLLYLHQFISKINGNIVDGIISYYIWNPCTKEYKHLPPPPPPLLVDGVDVGNLKNHVMNFGHFDYSSSSGFCGFGYDRKNDEYKILHFENSVHPNYTFRADRVRVLQSLSSILEFKLYTLGTDKWTLIADNPYRSFCFTETSRKIGLLVNGALHWIMSLSNLAPKGGKIVSFDIEKEVFRELQKPRYYSSSSKEVEEEEEEKELYTLESLQTLRGCLCMCQVHNYREVNKIDIWMLQDYDVMDSWTKLFRVVIREEFNYFQFRLLRYCANGELVMLRNYKEVIVYDPVNHKTRCAKKFNESIPSHWKYYMDYTESLVCLNSGTYTTTTTLTHS